jgi:hypothetical protein
MGERQGEEGRWWWTYYTRLGNSLHEVRKNCHGADDCEELHSAQREVFRQIRETEF